MIYKITIQVLDDGIKADARTDDGRLDVFVEHLTFPSLLLFIVGLREGVGVMLDSLLFRNAITGMEVLFLDETGVCLETVQLRYIPLDEDFQVSEVDEFRRVGDDGRQELFI